ncbi:MAG: hypothetical protein ACXW27_08985 [Allosphingosinicella sp.]
MKGAASRPGQACRDVEDALRETIARGVYDARPFTMAVSGGVMEVMRVDQVLDWESAPRFYRSECFEIADGVLARMLLDQQRDAGEALERAAVDARAA